MTEQPVPINLSEREQFMDALRGFAILGIFIVNLSGLCLYNPESTTIGWHFGDPDKEMLFLQHLFLEGKFYSIFSLLFGWGLALQIKRTQTGTGGLRVHPIITRRLLFMFLIGLIHLAVIWNGDIITLYALVGFVLLLFVRIRPGKLLLIGVGSLLVPIVSYWLRVQAPILNKPADFFHSVCEYLDSKLLGISTPEDFANLLRRGSLPELLIYNFDGAFYRFGDLIFQSRFFKVLGMFLIGYALGTSGYFKILVGRRWSLWIVAAIGLIVGLPANYVLARFMETPSNYMRLTMEGFYQTIVYALGVVPLALAYVSLLALFFRNKVGNQIVMLLTPVGKMALTNYILHSLLCIVIFYGIGFGLMGTLGPIAWTVFALIMFAFQIIYSTIWLQYFQFGPLEWVWRSLTYGKLQPMIRERVFT
ncbi:MAG TPA: DUF418 domain-containing protein [Chryseolinea sp.]|nr:DUF418 domain-containing protein [Chryseolinea sp.]